MILLLVGFTMRMLLFSDVRSAMTKQLSSICAESMQSGHTLDDLRMDMIEVGASSDVWSCLCMV